jgi:hypothetical protein
MTSKFDNSSAPMWTRLWNSLDRVEEAMSHEPVTPVYVNFICQLPFMTRAEIEIVRALIEEMYPTRYVPPKNAYDKSNWRKRRMATVHKALQKVHAKIAAEK